MLEIERLTGGSEGGGWKSAHRVTRQPPTLLHVRFGVGAAVELPGLHHYEFLNQKSFPGKRMAP